MSQQKLTKGEGDWHLKFNANADDVEELRDDKTNILSTIGNETMGTTATTLKGAIAEHSTQLNEKANKDGTLQINLNADKVDGYDTSTLNTASTIVVRDASGVIKAGVSTLVNASIVIADSFSVGYSAFSNIFSNIALMDSKSYLLTVESIQGSNSSITGIYLCSPTGTQKNVNTILGNSDITVTIGADYKVNVTRVTGNSIGANCSLIRLI